MREWKSDADLLGLIRKELNSAVIGDICDELGLRNQFLPPSIRPLDGGNRRILAGRAMPVLEADLEEEGEGPPFGLMFEALDSLRPDEIYLAAGSRQPYALFGELMSLTALKRGAAGAVCDGYVRDTGRILDLQFPVFCHGSYARDQRVRGRVLEYRVPLAIGGTRIEPGDILVGDSDGVVAIPRQAEEVVVSRALAKARLECGVRQALREGMRATAAFEQFGVF